jgi:nucleotide-binding universal stress UspA family protein
MKLLILFNNSPYQDQLLCFARRLTDDGRQGRISFLAVVHHDEYPAERRAALVASLNPAELENLHIRIGSFSAEALAEIDEGDYDLVLIAADDPAQPAEDQAGAAHLAHLCPLPLAMVRHCPTAWDRALICAPTTELDTPAVRAGLAMSASLDLEPSILHVQASELQDGEDDEKQNDESGEILVRTGSILDEIGREIAEEGLEIVMVGFHNPPTAAPEPGTTTMLRPNVTQQLIRLAPPVLIVVQEKDGRAALEAQEVEHQRHVHDLRRLIRQVIIEIAIYGVLVVAYAAIAFKLLVGPLEEFYENNLLLYAIIALLLIVGQGTLLETLTSFLLDRLRLERFD